LTPDTSIGVKSWLVNPMVTGRVIVILMAPSLLVDCMTGWMTIYAPSPLSPSQLYRSGIFMLIFLWLASFWRLGFMLVLGVLSCSFVLMTLHSLPANSLTSFAMDFRFNLSLFAHFIYFVFLFGYFQVIKIDKNELQRFKKVIYWTIWFSFVVIATNVIIGVFGVGYSTLESYVKEDEFGSGGGKGFFVAGNDLSSTFLLVVGMLLMKIWSSRHFLKYHLLAFIFMIVAVMLLTKAAILGVLILMVGIPLCMSRVVSGLRIRVRPLAPLIWGGILGIAAVTWLIFSNSAIVRRAIYLYESSDFFVAVTTGRSDFLSAAIDAWNETYDFSEWFFGRGWDGAKMAIGKFLGIAKTVEIDYVDVLMINGLVGLFLAVFVWVYYLFNAWVKKRESPVALAVVFVNILLMGLAGSSGHILFSSMNGMFVALLNILPMVESRRHIQHV
jgi:hypothetical protein